MVKKGEGSFRPREESGQRALEDQFEKLVEGADSDTQKTAAFRRICEEADDSGDYEEALRNMEAFLKQRDAVLDRTEVIWQDKNMRIRQEDVEDIISHARNAIRNPDGFLGNGSVAEVYTMPGSQGSSCVKWITDYARYAEGVPVEQEVRFLDELRDLEVDGVRAPRPVCVFSSLRMKGIIMEKLRAVNFRRVIEGRTTEGVADELPPSFDVHRFFVKLENYVRKMHDLGIYHGDLHLRNIMIDRHTGNPYLIDFGKGVFERELDKASPLQRDYAANDMEALRLAKIEAVAWVLKSRKKGLT